MKITVFRLDYKNRNDRGIPVLPILNSIDAIQDINEVKSIGCEFETKEQAEAFVAKFPKYFKLRVGSLCGFDGDKYFTGVPYVSIQFNTFWANNVTKEKNESAINKRKRFIETLQSILNQ